MIYALLKQSISGFGDGLFISMLSQESKLKINQYYGQFLRLYDRDKSLSYVKFLKVPI